MKNWTKERKDAGTEAMIRTADCRRESGPAVNAPGARERHRGRELWRGLLHQREGSTLIEVSVVMLLIVVVFLAIFEFSMALTSYCSATYAVRSGTRFASLHSSTSLSPAATSDIQNVVNATLFMPGGSGQSVTVTYANYNGVTQGNYVGNVVGVNLKWTQRVTIPGYTASFPVQSTMYRMVTR